MEGWPDLEEVAEILSRRLNADKEEIMRIFERNASEVDELFWFEVGRAIEDLGNELGVEIYQYVYDFVVFKDNLPERFFRAVERTVMEHEDQNFWADFYEDFVKDELMKRKEQV